jgi:hypothetical protein
MGGSGAFSASTPPPPSSPPLLGLLLLLLATPLFVTLASAADGIVLPVASRASTARSGYSINPTMECKKVNDVLSFVVRIPVTDANRDRIHVDAVDKDEKAFVEKDGKRCAASKAAKVTESSKDYLEITAPLNTCGEVKDAVGGATLGEDGTVDVVATVKVDTDDVIVTTNHIFTLICQFRLGEYDPVDLPGGIKLENPFPCNSNPCFNGGECKKIDNPDDGQEDYNCTCLTGYTGYQCQRMAPLLDDDAACGDTPFSDFTASKTEDDSQCRGRCCILNLFTSGSSSIGSRINLQGFKSPFGAIPAFDQSLGSATIHRNGLVYFKGEFSFFDQPTIWAQMTDRETVLLSPFWVNFATSVGKLDNDGTFAQIKVRQYTENDLRASKDSSDLVKKIEAQFGNETEIRWLLIVRWENMLAPGIDGAERLSFEMAMVSDQLKTWVSYNYGEVGLEAGFRDQYLDPVWSTLGYHVTEREAEFLVDPNVALNFQAKDRVLTEGEKCDTGDGPGKECVRGFRKFKLYKEDEIQDPQKFYLWALDQRENNAYYDRKKRRSGATATSDGPYCNVREWEDRINQKKLNCPCDVDTVTGQDGQPIPNPNSPKLGKFNRRSDFQFQSIEKDIDDYHISEHMLPYVQGDFHKQGDFLNLTAKITCFKLCEYEVLAGSTTANLKKLEDNKWGGLTCENYPMDPAKNVFNSDNDVKELAFQNPDWQKLFRQCRPMESADSCIKKIPTASQSAGDPHITTLDGFTYTFNGLGEYVMVRLGDNDEAKNCKIITRTEKSATAEVGVFANATIFTAVLLTCPPKAGSTARTSILIKANGLDTGFDIFFCTKETKSECQKLTAFHLLKDFDETSEAAGFRLIRLHEEGEPSSVKVIYGPTRDLDMTVTYNVQQQAIIPLARVALGHVVIEGLLGNNNENDKDDLKPEAKSPLNLDGINDRKIHYDFGETWRMTQDQDVWPRDATLRKRRSGGETWAEVNKPSFEPLFFEEIQWPLGDLTKESASATCKGVKTCMFDLALTNLKAFAEATGAADEDLKARRAEEKDVAPVFNAPSEAITQIVTIGEELTFTVNVTDEDGDDIVVSLLSDEALLTGDVSFNQTTFLFKWKPTNSTFEGNLRFKAVAKTKEIALDLPIQFCDCNNLVDAGKCNNDNPRQDLTTKIRYATCTCDPEWEGIDCKKDVDRCGAGDIGETNCGVNNCVDIPAEQSRTWRLRDINVVFKCKDCKSGFELKQIEGVEAGNNNCADLNECKSDDDNVCNATRSNCVNMEGDYRCDCLTGYKRGKSNKECDDVDECASADLNQCTHICINEIGSHICKCQEGYVLADDGFTCNPGEDLQCEAKGCVKDFCRTNNNTVECFCPSGMKLENDGKTCVNVDECASDDTNKCTDGSTCNDNVITLSTYLVRRAYTCECPKGSKVDDTSFGCTGCRDLDKYSYGVECGQECLCKVRGECDAVDGCKCPSGYKLPTCNEDINECVENATICDSKPNSFCRNTVGSYECVCDKGFEQIGDKCQNIDECQRSTANDCDKNAECTDLTPTKDNPDDLFKCKCKLNYEGDGKSCSTVQLDECVLTPPCDKNALCVDTPASYTCTCNEGYVGNGKSCADEQECERDVKPCHVHATCTNTIGSYECDCKNGFQGDGLTCEDLNECTNGKAECDSNAICENTIGSYTCTCKDGYEGDGKTCKDKDECDIGTSDCHVNATCNNIAGSYDCICVSGYTGEGKGSGGCQDINECDEVRCRENSDCINTEGSYECRCKSGFKEETNACVDVDECAENATICDWKKDTECENTVGAYYCRDIKCTTAGTELQNSTCVDIDECARNLDNCDEVRANCINQDANQGGNLALIGTFKCVCKSGFTGDGTTCTDVDECAKSSTYDCHPDANCVNTIGSYKCICKDGFLGNGTACAEIDECQPNPCQKNANCTDRIADYACECRSGYVGNDKVKDELICYDINECLNNVTNDCDENAKCSNTEGSYECECNGGYAGDGRRGNCADVDECDANPCEPNAICKNTVGSFECPCEDGYAKKGGKCKNIDECTKSLCKSNQKCEDTEGSYVCSCPAGYQEKNKIRENVFDCEDVDECASVATNECQADAKCKNTEGGYECASTTYFCSKTPTSVTCKCKSGYTNETSDFSIAGIGCENINECVDGTNTCPKDNSICQDEEGSYNCTCVTGWQPEPNKKLDGSYGGGCGEDIDECKKDKGGCHANATCTNTMGSRNCTCKEGFTGLGIGDSSCDDVDECEDGNNGGCHVNADCNNTIGSRECNCKGGYTGNGINCGDIDECNDGNNGGCDVNADCNNTVGSRECNCKGGFTGNGTYCEDVNECTDGNNGGCDFNATCNNTVGSRECICGGKYNKTGGFTGEGVGNGSCADVNECIDGNNGGCDRNAKCDNTIGSRNCNCNGGYTGNGTFCQDVDECEDANGGCDSQAKCENTIGSRNCTCNQGFVGNGTYCEDVDECKDGNNGGCIDQADCNNIIGSSECICKAGYDGNGTYCEDVDECEDGTNGGCHVNADCNNTVGPENANVKEGMMAMAQIVKMLMSAKMVITVGVLLELTV